MVEEKQTVDKTSPLMGLYHKLKRQFRRLEVEKEHTKSLGSSVWRKAAGKERYVKVALAVTRPRTTDIVTPFASALYADVDAFMGAVYEKFTVEYIEGGLEPKTSLFKRLYEPSSIANKTMQYEAIKQYYNTKTY